MNDAEPEEEEGDGEGESRINLSNGLALVVCMYWREWKKHSDQSVMSNDISLDCVSTNIHHESNKAKNDLRW